MFGITLKSIYLRVFFWLNLISAIFLILAYMAAYVPPTKLSVLAFFALGYPFLLLVNFFWIFFWLYHKSRAIYFSLGAVLLGVFNVPFVFGMNGLEDIPANKIRVMTYNVRYFNTSVGKDPAYWLKSQDEILEFIQEQNPDIFFGQEFSGRGKSSTERANQFLIKKAKLPYVFQGGGSSLAIHSRFPIINTGTISFKNSFNGAIFADIAYEDKTLRVYCVHLQSTRLGEDAQELLKKEDITHLNQKETQEKYQRIESKLSNAFEMRVEQARALAKHIEKCPYPVLLAGDFNDTPLSYAYRILSEGFKDSFVEKGQGLGTTYAGRIPALRIDYILVSKQFSVFSHLLQPKAISDHYAVWSDIAWMP